jgi:hypothetical protein
MERASRQAVKAAGWALAALVAWYLLVRPGIEGDTLVLAENALSAAGCLRDGRAPCPEAGQFPLLQLGPAILLALIGVGKLSIVRALAFLSPPAFLASVLLARRLCARRSAAVATLVTGLLLSGYWLRYFNLSFSEMLAAFLTLALVASILAERPAPLAAGLLFLAALGREIALPFLLLLAATAEFAVPGKRRPSRAELAWLAAGAVAALAATGALNWFRWRSVLNVQYLNPALLVPTLPLQLSLTAGLWLSPSGGLLWFWPLLCALLATLGWRASDRRALAGVALVLGALSFGFGRWVAPFGWSCWGPRLLMPWLPASACLLCYRYARELETTLRSLARRPAAFASAAAVFALAAVPQYKVLLAPQWIQWLLEGHCAPGTRPFALDCLMATVWPGRLVLPRMFLPNPDPAYTAVSYSLAVFYFLAALGLARRLRVLDNPGPVS